MMTKCVLQPLTVFTTWRVSSLLLVTELRNARPGPGHWLRIESWREKSPGYILLTVACHSQAVTETHITYFGELKWRMIRDKFQNVFIKNTFIVGGWLVGAQHSDVTNNNYPPPAQLRHVKVKTLGTSSCRWFSQDIALTCVMWTG